MPGKKTIGFVKASRKDLQQSHRHRSGFLQHLEEVIRGNSKTTGPLQSHHTGGSRTLPQNSKFAEHFSATEFAQKHFDGCVGNRFKNPYAARNNSVCRPSMFV